MRRLPLCLLALAAPLVACSKHAAQDASKPAEVAAGTSATAHANTPEQPSETPPALSPAELAPGTAVDLGDGLKLTVTRAGSGAPAHAGARVELRYSGKVQDAESAFASTEGWDAPLAIVLGSEAPPHLLPALERALVGLRAGAQARVEIPAALGFQKDGPAGTEDKALVFELELVGVDG